MTTIKELIDREELTHGAKILLAQIDTWLIVRHIDRSNPKFIGVEAQGLDYAMYSQDLNANVFIAEGTPVLIHTDHRVAEYTTIEEVNHHHVIGGDTVDHEHQQ